MSASTNIVLSRDNVQTAFSSEIPPVLEVAPGTVVSFDAGDDTYARLATGESLDEIGMEEANRVTGPVTVSGAEPGDAVRVDILDIEIERVWTAWQPGLGALGHRVPSTMVRELPVRGATAIVNDSIALRMRPCIGCIGVAPASGRGSTMGPAGPWGGNMDLRELEPGVTLLLPVHTAGGLLSLGDLHAALGQGEPTGTGLEASGVATVRLDLSPRLQLSFPRILTPDATICVGMGDTHPLARRRAMEQVLELLLEHGLDPLDAYAYMSSEVELRLGGPASPIVLAVVRLP